MIQAAVFMARGGVASCIPAESAMMQKSGGEREKKPRGRGAILPGQFDGGMPALV